MRALAAALFFIACTSISEAEEKDIQLLIEELNAEDFSTRERASWQIWSLGEKAIIPLQRAVESKEPELAIRARDILRKIELRLTPETDSEILLMLEFYYRANLREKGQVLRGLGSKAAYYQALKLYSQESASAQEALIRNITNFGYTMASRLIVEGKRQEAIEMLQMSAGSNLEVFALAQLYRSSGLSLDETSKQKYPRKVTSQRWQIALNLVWNQFDKAKDLAKATNQKKLYAALNMFSGDPTTWLELTRDSQSSQRSSKVAKQYAKLALKKWNGQAILDADINVITNMLESEKSRFVTQRLVAAISLLGKPEITWNSDYREDDIQLFSNLLMHDRYRDALNLIGVDDLKTGFTKYLKQQLADEKNEMDGLFSEVALRKVSMLLYFLEKKRMTAVIEQDVIPFLLWAASENEAGFQIFLRNLAGVNLNNGRLKLITSPDLSLQIGMAWAKDDPEKQATVEQIILETFDNFVDQNFLAFMAEAKPGASKLEILHGLIALFSANRVSKGLSSEWIARFWKLYDRSDPPEQQRIVIQMLSNGIFMRDIASALRAFDVVENNRFSHGMEKYLAAAGRWEDAAAKFVKGRRRSITQQMLASAYRMIALKKAGKQQQFEAALRELEELSLATSQQMHFVVNIMRLAGENKLAMQWLKRSALFMDLKQWRNSEVLEDYIDCAVLEGEWLSAASVTSVSALISMEKARIGGVGSGVDSIAFHTKGFQRDYYRAMSLLDAGQEREALDMLEQLHQVWVGNGILGDHFYFQLRERGYREPLEKWFSQSYEFLQKQREIFPNDKELNNKIGWLASRSRLRLNEADQLMKDAVTHSPELSHYLDTMAEVYFAKGNRKKAIEWSERAVNYATYGNWGVAIEIVEQRERFYHAPLPKN